MPKTIFGLFTKPSEASEVMRELVAMGVARDDIGFIAKAAEAKAQDPDSTRATVAAVKDADVDSVETLDTDFRKNFDATFATRGYTYEQAMPAYHYGYMLAIDPRHRGKDWTAIVVEAKQEWESLEKGLWEEFEGAVRYGWDRAHGREQEAQATL